MRPAAQPRVRRWVDRLGALAAGVEEIAVFTAASETFNRKNINDFGAIIKRGVAENVAFYRVFREAMRLHPPVPFMPRLVLADAELAGYRIPRGSMVGVSALLLHRLPEYWTDPASFDPLRFAPDRAEHRAHSGHEHEQAGPLRLGDVESEVFHFSGS